MHSSAAIDKFVKGPLGKHKRADECTPDVTKLEHVFIYRLGRCQARLPRTLISHICPTPHPLLACITLRLTFRVWVFFIFPLIFPIFCTRASFPLSRSEWSIKALTLWIIWVIFGGHTAVSLVKQTGLWGQTCSGVLVWLCPQDTYQAKTEEMAKTDEMSAEWKQGDGVLWSVSP